MVSSAVKGLTGRIKRLSAERAGTTLSATPDLEAQVWAGVARWLVDIPLLRDRLPILEYGQDVAGGVLEPSDQRASAAEDALLVHLKTVVPFETNSALG